MKNTNLIKLGGCLVALLCSVCCTFGQGKAKEASVVFKVTRFDPGDRPSPEFRVGSSSERVALKVPLTHIAGPFKAKLRDGRYLDFWRGAGKKPEMTIQVAESERKGILLVFVPRPSGQFSVIKINASEKKMSGGDRCIINATQSSLAIKLSGMSPIMVESKKAGVLRAPKGKDVASVLIKERRNKSWGLVSTEDWHFDRRFRKFLFIYRSPQSNALLFHGVSERL